MLFVGDFSDGDLRLTRLVTSLSLPVAVILGNHDHGRDKSGGILTQQLALLGERHCAWTCRVLDPLPLSIVGGRPCSAGGGFHLSGAVRAVYGPVSLEESVKRIVEAAQKVPDDQPLIVMAHCGPTGLGSEPSSPCGRDWKIPAVDWGDQDLAQALDQIATHRPADLVVFGHMHHGLRRGLGLRESLVRDRRGTAYLNAACVPRSGMDANGQMLLNLSWAEFNGSKLTQLSHRWYTPDGQISHEEILDVKDGVRC